VVIINSHREIVSTGFNEILGAAPDCIKKGCFRDDMNVERGTGYDNCPAVHAEENAINQAGKDARDCTLYINSYPCESCSHLIVEAGLNKVVTTKSHPSKEGLKILKEAGVEIQKSKRESA
jgi:dCMP deaminase